MTNESEILLKAYQIRLVEEGLLRLSQEGSIKGTLHTCLGQELISAVFSKMISIEDVVFSTHRSHGHFLATLNLPFELIAELSGKQDGVCEGIGGSQHLQHRNFFSSGIVGGLLPAGAGTAFVLKRASSTGIAVNFLGDGALGEGIVYETFNIAAKMKLPQLFILENNFYSQSTSQEETLAGSFEMRAHAFGLNYIKSDVWNLGHLVSSMSQAFADVRSGKPTLLQIDCFRLGPHSRGDDNRSESELKKFLEMDLLGNWLKGMRSSDSQALADVEQEVKAAFQRATEALPAKTSKHRIKLNLDFAPEKTEVKGQLPFARQLNESLRKFLEKSPRAIMIGEDLKDTYGGAFKISRGLSTAFPDQVLNFPISEALIVGFASGVALRGNPVIAEIMFSDFLGLAFDQLLNHASKFHHMYAGKVNCRMIIRTPTGGRRGYGATHSQAMEKFFCGIPGLHVLLLHHRCNVHNFYESLYEKITGPTLVFENKSLYGWFPTELPQNYSLGWTTGGTCRIARNSGVSDLTIVAFGECGLQAEEAIKLLEREEIYVELFLPLIISELDIGPVLSSLKTTAKLIVVEEGTSGYSLASELISSLHGKVPFNYRKVCSTAVVIPASSELESESLPDTQKILSSCLELFDE